MARTFCSVPMPTTWLSKLTTAGRTRRGCVHLHTLGWHQSSLKQDTDLVMDWLTWQGKATIGLGSDKKLSPHLVLKRHDCHKKIQNLIAWLKPTHHTMKQSNVSSWFVALEAAQWRPYTSLKETGLPPNLQKLTAWTRPTHSTSISRSEEISLMCVQSDSKTSGPCQKFKEKSIEDP